jgi:hypothetical protein
MSFGVADKKRSTYYIDIIIKNNFVAQFMGLQKLAYIYQAKRLKVRMDQYQKYNF